MPDREPAETDSRWLSANAKKGALWIVARSLLLKSANMLLTAIVARILAPRDFGVFAVALTVYTIVSVLSELGVSSCLIRADLDPDRLAPTVTTISVLSSVVLAIAMAAFASPIATALGSAAAVGPIRVMAIAVVQLSVFAVPGAQLTRDFKQDKLFLAHAIGFVPSTALLILLAKSGSGAMAFAWSRVVDQFVTGCVQFALVERRYRPGLTRSALSVVLRFGIPLAAANFVSYILLNVDYAFVGHFLGAVELGLYVLAYTVASWPYGLVGSVINFIGMPAFSRVKNDPDLLRNAITVALRAVTLIVLPMCAMMAALSRPLVLTLYGAKWAASAEVLVILSIYAAVSMACLLFANTLTALGETRLFLVLQLIWIGALIPAMALGVHEDGIVGAAYAHAVVIGPVVLPSYALALKRVTGVRITALGRAALPALLGSSVAALTAYAVASQFSSPPAQLVAGLAAGGATYAICAGQQTVSLFGLGSAAERIRRRYSAAARLVGLRVNSEMKHAATYGSERAAGALEHVDPLCASVLADKRRQLGAMQLEHLASRASLTHARHQGSWLSPTVAVYERTLAEQERLLGPDHPHTLASRANLAYAYRQVGLLAKAIVLYERTVAEQERLLGPDHPRTMRSGNYLASAYREAGRLADAIPLYERALADRLRLLGPGHPSSLRSANYLASAYRDAGRPADAIPLYEQTLTRCARVLGDDHLLTRAVGRNLSGARELIASRSDIGSAVAGEHRANGLASSRQTRQG